MTEATTATPGARREEPRERFVFQDGSELWVRLRQIPRVGENVTIYADAGLCRSFPAVGPTEFVVTAVEYELDYLERLDADENVIIFLEPKGGH